MAEQQVCFFWCQSVFPIMTQLLRDLLPPFSQSGCQESIPDAAGMADDVAAISTGKEGHRQ